MEVDAVTLRVVSVIERDEVGLISSAHGYSDIFRLSENLAEFNGVLDLFVFPPHMVGHGILGAYPIDEWFEASFLQDQE